jgi:putative DNA primase/helicase
MSNTPKLYDIGAEKAVLGSLFTDPAAIELPEIKALKPEDFYLVQHQWLFRAMSELHAQGKPHNDHVLLANKLGADKLEQLDDGAYTWHLLSDTPSTSHAAHYATLVARWAGKRNFWCTLLRAVQTFFKNASQSQGDALCHEIVEDLRQAVPQDRLAQSRQAGSTWADLDHMFGPVQWAWHGWLPLGFLTLLAGVPDSGKSALALRLAACFLRGDPWPDGTAYAGELGAVLWCEAEAAQAINLERARAWGLPLERMLNPLGDPSADVHLDDPDHRQAVTCMARRPEVKMIVIDSLSGAHRRDENSSKIITLVKWFARLARDTGKPILMTHHLRKRGMLDAQSEVSLERLRGSSAIVQPARVVWALDRPNPNDKETRRLSVIKNNLVRCAGPIGLRIAEQGILFCAAPKPPPKRPKLDQAIEALQASLGGGPMTSEALIAELASQGISEPTVRRAKAKLGVVSAKTPAGPWLWGLPYDDAEMS